MSTVARLHKLLGELIAQGHGRKPVVINKRTFSHPLESDGVCMLNVRTIEGPKWIYTADDDGGSKINADGTEAGRRVVVIIGDQLDQDAP